jgi:hypothetical protein
VQVILEAIEKAGYKPGHDVFLGIDAAASEFYENGVYDLKGEGKNIIRRAGLVLRGVGQEISRYQHRGRDVGKGLEGLEAPDRLRLRAPDGSVAPPRSRDRLPSFSGTSATRPYVAAAHRRLSGSWKIRLRRQSKISLPIGSLAAGFGRTAWPRRRMRAALITTLVSHVENRDCLLKLFRFRNAESNPSCIASSASCALPMMPSAE